MKNIVARNLLMFILFFVLLNGLAYLSYTYLSDFLTKNIPEIYNTIDTFIYLPILLIILIFFKKNKRTLKEKSIINFKTIVTIIILSILFRIFEDPIFRYKEILFNNSIDTYLAKKPSDFKFTLNFMIIFINSVILGPVVEELFFRNFILRNFIKEKHILFGILFSSILFGVMHISITSVVSSFFFGLIASLIFIRKGILYSIFFHSIYNLIWLTLKIYSVEYFQIIKELNFNIIYWVIFIFSFLSLIFSLKTFYKKKAT